MKPTRSEIDFQPKMDEQTTTACGMCQWEEVRFRFFVFYVATHRQRTEKQERQTCRSRYRDTPHGRTGLHYNLLSFPIKRNVVPRLFRQSDSAILMCIIIWFDLLPRLPRQRLLFPFFRFFCLWTWIRGIACQSTLDKSFRSCSFVQIKTNEKFICISWP